MDRTSKIEKATKSLAAFFDYTEVDRRDTSRMFATAPGADNPLLEHVLLSLAIGLEGRTRRLDRGIEILDRMATFLANAVAELEAFDFSNRTDVQAALVRAAARSARGRDDSTRILILGRFRIRVLDDVLDDPMRSLFGILLADVATNSSQRFFLTSFPSPPGC